MPRFKSGSGCDAIENLACLLLLAALFLRCRQIGRAEVGLFHLLLLGLLALLLGGREVGYGEIGFLLARLGLLLLCSRKVGYGEIGFLLARLGLLLLCSRKVGDAEIGFLLARLSLLLLRSREVGYPEIGFLLARLGLLFFRGRQLIALDDAADCRCRVRRQAHRGEEAERDSNSSDLAHCVCPLKRSTRMAGAFLSGSGNCELQAIPQTNIL